MDTSQFFYRLSRILIQNLLEMKSHIFPPVSHYIPTMLFFYLSRNQVEVIIVLRFSYLGYLLEFNIDLPLQGLEFGFVDRSSIC